MIGICGAAVVAFVLLLRFALAAGPITLLRRRRQYVLRRLRQPGGPLPDDPGRHQRCEQPDHRRHGDRGDDRGGGRKLREGLHLPRRPRAVREPRKHDHRRDRSGAQRRYLLPGRHSGRAAANFSIDGCTITGGSGELQTNAIAGGGVFVFRGRRGQQQSDHHQRPLGRAGQLLWRRALRRCRNAR